MFLAKCKGLDWDEHQDWTGGRELPALPEPLHFTVPDFLPGISGDPVLLAAFSLRGGGRPARGNGAPGPGSREDQSGGKLSCLASFSSRLCRLPPSPGTPFRFSAAVKEEEETPGKS